jgi:chromosome segregation ATPase
MNPSDKLAKPSVADRNYRWLTTGYWPIAFAAAGCAAAIAIAFEAKDLSRQREVLERGRPPPAKIVAEDSLTRHDLIDLRGKLRSIEAKEKNHQQMLLITQHKIEKAQKDKADATRETDKTVKEEPRLDFDRAAAEKRIEAVRGQFEDRQKRLSILEDKFMRGQVKLASLIDQRARLKAVSPQMTIDPTRLQGTEKLLENAMRSSTKQRDAVASNISRAQRELHQLQLSRAGQTRELEGFKRLVGDLRKRSEHTRKDVAELERMRAPPAPQTAVPAPIAIADQPNQEERREAELRSQNTELDAKRIELEKNVEALQLRKEELVKTNKSFQDQLDAAAANLASTMEQVKSLEPDRREALALQAQLEELNREIDERRKMIDHPAKPAPRSRAAHPVPFGATDQPPRGTR